MELKSVSGFVCMVKDPEITYKFYKKLGFRIEQHDAEYVKARINWFWIDFIKAGSHQSTGNNGQFIYVAVDDVDGSYEWLKASKLDPTKPETYKTGRRETMITDPDGYKLVFFSKK